MNGTPAAAARRCSSSHVLLHRPSGRAPTAPLVARACAPRSTAERWSSYRRPWRRTAQRAGRRRAATSRPRRRGAHRHVLDARRPRPLVHELPLRAQILALARRPLGRRLPQPPARELMISQTPPPHRDPPAANVAQPPRPRSKAPPAAAAPPASPTPARQHTPPSLPPSQPRADKDCGSRACSSSASATRPQHRPRPGTTSAQDRAAQRGRSAPTHHISDLALLALEILGLS